MKKLMTTVLSLCLALALAAPAFAYDYTIPAPSGPAYADATSIETVIGVPIKAQRSGFDGERSRSGMSELSPSGGSEGYGACGDDGAAKNEDVSKNAAYIPPVFGSQSAYTPNYAAYLTPNLAPNAMAAAGAGVGGVSVTPPAYGTVNTQQASLGNGSGTVTVSGTRPYTGEKRTEVTRDLYYSGGHLGTLKIPTIGVNVRVYQGTDSNTLAKGAGHFEETSIWNGNVAIAGHNRGANCYFGELHTLAIGDRITYTTKLGTRTYAVTSVAKVNETDRGGLAASSDNILTLYTCVRDQRAYRWCVTAAEIG